MIDIKNKLGATIFSTPIIDGCIRRFTLMKEDYVSIRFNAKTPIVFSLGDGIDSEYGMFELVDLYKPTYNDGDYSYELRLDGKNGKTDPLKTAESDPSKTVQTDHSKTV